MNYANTTSHIIFSIVLKELRSMSQKKLPPLKFKADFILYSIRLKLLSAHEDNWDVLLKYYRIQRDYANAKC